MNYNRLLDFATDLGYELSMCGAETYRVEDSITRILGAYGMPCEVFAIPNSIIVSITLPDGTPLTRMRRMGFHGNNLDGVELFSNLSRKICYEKPDVEVAEQLLEEARKSMRFHPRIIQLIGYFLGAAGFSLFFGGNVIDTICGGFSGVVTGACLMFMDRFEANNFFKTLLAALPLALVTYISNHFGFCPNADAATTGAVMVLIPGLLFTYAMRDIIFGDTNSGVNRIVQVVMIAVAIACGTAAAWGIVTAFWGAPVSVPKIDHSFWVECIGATLGCIGFSFLFNIHGPGMLLCTLGGIFGWGVYCLVIKFGGDDLAAMLVSSALTAVYAEVMARIRKCPTIGYLVVSMIPLIPGSALYYTMNYAVQGETEKLATQGMFTTGLAGMMATGILLVSTSVRMWSVWKAEHIHKNAPKK